MAFSQGKTLFSTRWTGLKYWENNFRIECLTQKNWGTWYWLYLLSPVGAGLTVTPLDSSWSTPVWSRPSTCSWTKASSWPHPAEREPRLQFPVTTHLSHSLRIGMLTKPPIQKIYIPTIPRTEVDCCETCLQSSEGAQKQTHHSPPFSSPFSQFWLGALNVLLFQDQTYICFEVCLAPNKNRLRPSEEATVVSC